MKRETGTIFKIYLLDKTGPGKQEGFLQLWKHRGQIVKGASADTRTFDHLNELEDKIKKALQDAGIQWPPQP